MAASELVYLGHAATTPMAEEVVDAVLPWLSDGFGNASASYRLGLQPGKYNVRIGALDETTMKGSVADRVAEVPDFNTGDLTVASLIAVRDIEENAQNDPAHPFAAYLLGSARLVPYAALTFAKSDALNIFYQYYDETIRQARIARALMPPKTTTKIGRIGVPSQTPRIQAANGAAKIIAQKGLHTSRRSAVHVRWYTPTKGANKTQEAIKGIRVESTLDPEVARVPCVANPKTVTRDRVSTSPGKLAMPAVFVSSGECRIE